MNKTKLGGTTHGPSDGGSACMIYKIFFSRFHKVQIVYRQIANSSTRSNLFCYNLPIGWWNSLIKWNWLFTFSPFKILQRWFFKKVDKTKTTLLGWIHWSLFTEVVVMFLCLTWWFTDLLEYVLKNVKSIWNVYIYFQ